jgi:hypothetical protein
VNMPKESDLPPLRCPILPLFRGCSPPSGTERVRPPKDTSLLVGALDASAGGHAVTATDRDLVDMTDPCLAAVAAHGVVVHAPVRTWPAASAVAAVDVGGILA